MPHPDEPGPVEVDDRAVAHVARDRPGHAPAEQVGRPEHDVRPREASVGRVGRMPRGGPSAAIPERLGRRADP